MPRAGLVVTGVYIILNLINGKVYVGGAYKSFNHRWSLHIRDLCSGRHINKHLLAAWNKYGQDAFEFIIIERHLPDGLKQLETDWIASYNATDPKCGYNKSPTGGSPLGTKHSPEYGRAVSERWKNRSDEEKAEIKAKIGAKSKGRPKTPELRSAQSERSKLMWQNQEIRNAIIKKNRGKKRTTEQKERLAASLRGRKLSDEHRKKVQVANLGKKQSQETIEKRAAKLRGRERPPEVVAKIKAANTGKVRTGQAYENVANAQRLRYKRPEELLRLRMMTQERVRKAAERKANRPKLIPPKLEAIK